MVEIIPAIIAKNFDELKEKIKSVEQLVERVQLDISDGIFTTMKTWDEPERLKEIETKLSLEVHLMISQPENQLDRWIASGVKRILVHYESTDQLVQIIEKIKSSGLEAGLVLNLQTIVDVLDNLPEMAGIDIVQLMGIGEIGYYGHPFSERVLPKILALRERFPQIKIAVDGGINVETGAKAAQMGADVLVSGSAIFGSGDVGKAIEELRKTISN